VNIVADVIAGVILTCPLSEIFVAFAPFRETFLVSRDARNLHRAIYVFFFPLSVIDGSDSSLLNANVFFRILKQSLKFNKFGNRNKLKFKLTVSTSSFINTTAIFFLSL
jgi:hypothetical protein